MKPLPKFVPVIHVVSDEQALNQANIAFDNGAGGVFLIDHKRKASKLIQSYHFVRAKYPDKWIGINFLDLKSIYAVQYMPEKADALWIDDGGWYRDTEGTLLANLIWATAELCGTSPRVANPWKLFSGFEFKYQTPATNLEEAAEWAKKYTSVPTTSGDGTGLAADLDKVIKIKSLLGDKPLALASGVTLENVEDFKPYVDCFMVATGISKTFDEFDPIVLSKMADLLT